MNRKFTKYPKQSVHASSAMSSVTLEDIKEAATAHNYTGNIEEEIAELGGDQEQLYMIYDDIVNIGNEVAQKNLGSWRLLLPSETEFDEPVISTDSGYYVVCARGSIQLVPIEAEALFGEEEFDEFDEEGGPTITASTEAAQGDVTVSDLADLMRASWESVNAEWGNSAEDLLEWQDAFYVDEGYRNCVAETAIENIPQLSQVNMSQVHIEADEDENSGELLFTIQIDGTSVGKVRTWYVADRYDASVELV